MKNHLGHNPCRHKDLSPFPSGGVAPPPLPSGGTVAAWEKKWGPLFPLCHKGFRFSEVQPEGRGQIFRLTLPANSLPFNPHEATAFSAEPEQAAGEERVNLPPLAV